jgi:hypothetical protein
VEEFDELSRGELRHRDHARRRPRDPREKKTRLYRRVQALNVSGYRRTARPESDDQRHARAHWLPEMWGSEDVGPAREQRQGAEVPRRRPYGGATPSAKAWRWSVSSGARSELAE